MQALCPSESVLICNVYVLPMCYRLALASRFDPRPADWILR